MIQYTVVWAHAAEDDLHVEEINQPLAAFSLP